MAIMLNKDIVFIFEEEKTDIQREKVSHLWP